ncbi:hypothetical protein JCM10599A_56820 [Paraburkholderia kururiensis]
MRVSPFVARSGCGFASHTRLPRSERHKLDAPVRKTSGGCQRAGHCTVRPVPLRDQRRRRYARIHEKAAYGIGAPLCQGSQGERAIAVVRAVSVRSSLSSVNRQSPH